VKRRGRAEDAHAAFSEIRESISRGHANEEISDSDRDIVRAETLNLQALISVRAGDISHAYRLMVEAHRLSQENKWVSVDMDFGYRYRTQIETNLSQILWTLDRREESLALLEETLRLTAGVHPMSRSETVSIASYFLYRAGHLSRAVDLIDEGIGLIAREGAPSRLRKARKIGAVILHDLGRVADATRMIETSVADPTGALEHERRLGRSK
jgi:tetratricopeptide (TPR) repeat protein